MWLILVDKWPFVLSFNLLFDIFNKLRKQGVQDLSRVLGAVKNSAVNAVFPICPILKLPNLCFPNTW